MFLFNEISIENSGVFWDLEILMAHTTDDSDVRRQVDK